MMESAVYTPPTPSRCKVQKKKVSRVWARRRRCGSRRSKGWSHCAFFVKTRRSAVCLTQIIRHVREEARSVPDIIVTYVSSKQHKELFVSACDCFVAGVGVPLLLADMAGKEWDDESGKEVSYKKPR